jgi:predicted kinase
MARLLLLLNGLPATGKSTLARAHASEQPNVRVLELDAVVASVAADIGAARDPWPVAWQVALDSIGVLLAGGTDVVFPQCVTATADVQRLADAAAAADAAFVHVVLAGGSPEQAARRFHARTERAETPQHRDAPSALPGRGSVAEFASLQAALDVVAQWPGTIALTVVDGDVAATCALLDQAIAGDAT